MKNETLAPATSAVNLFAILLVAILGLDFLDIPFDPGKTCGPSGYWAVPVMFVLVALPLVLLVCLMQRRFPGQNIISVAGQVLGRKLAIIGNIVFIGTYVFWLVLAIRDACDLTQIYFLSRTPLWAIMLFFITGVGYIAINGLAPAFRLMAFVLIPSVIIRFLMQILAMQGLKFSYLLPVFSAAPLDYLRGGMELASFYIPVTTVFLISPLIKNTKRIPAATLWAVIIATISAFLGVFGALGVLGHELTIRFNWSEFSQIRLINIPLLVLEQVGLLFQIVWMTMFFAATCYYFAIAAGGLRQQFPKINYRLGVAGLLILVGSTGLIFPDAIIAHKVFTDWSRWLTIPVAIYPLLIYLTDKLKRVKSKGKRVMSNE